MRLENLHTDNLELERYCSDGTVADIVNEIIAIKGSVAKRKECMAT